MLKTGNRAEIGSRRPEDQYYAARQSEIEDREHRGIITDAVGDLG